MSGNATMAEYGLQTPGQHLFHDRDTKFCPTFQETMKTGGVTHLQISRAQSEYERL